MSVTSSLSLLFGRLIRYGGGRLPGPGACSVRARYSEVSMIDRRGRASWGTERSATGGSAVFSGRTYATSVTQGVRGGGTVRADHAAGGVDGARPAGAGARRGTGAGRRRRRGDAGRLGGDGGQPRLALRPGTERRTPAGGADRPPRHRRAPAAEHGDPPGAAHRRRPVALAPRALVAVPHRHPGRGPRLGPAGHGRRGGPRPGPGTARLVQPLPRRPARRSRPAAALAPRPPPPRLDRAVRGAALLQPRAARGPGVRPGGDARRGAPLPGRRGALRRLLLPVSRPGPDLRRHRRLRRPRRRLPDPGGLAA